MANPGTSEPDYAPSGRCRPCLHSATRRTPPKVKTCSPPSGAASLSPATSARISVSGPASTMMRANAVWPRAKARNDAPIPQRTANFAKVATRAGPAIPTCTGHVMPRARCSRDPAHYRLGLEAELSDQRHIKSASLSERHLGLQCAIERRSHRLPDVLPGNRQTRHERCLGAPRRRCRADRARRGTARPGSRRRR